MLCDDRAEILFAMCRKDARTRGFVDGIKHRDFKIGFRKGDSLQLSNKET